MEEEIHIDKRLHRLPDLCEHRHQVHPRVCKARHLGTSFKPSVIALDGNIIQIVKLDMEMG